jgi:hypothetical protein
MRKIKEFRAPSGATDTIAPKPRVRNPRHHRDPAAPSLNGGQRRRSRRFIYMNGVAQGASHPVQRGPPMVASRSVMNRSIRSLGPARKAPEISQKGHIMFRKVAIALVAASVLAAPVLAQNAAPGSGKAPQTTTGTAPASTVKTVKADKAIVKHRFVVRHHRHGTKLAKHVTHVKYAHHMKHGKTATKQASGKPVAVKQVSAKPATRSGVN